MRFSLIVLVAILTACTSYEHAPPDITQELVQNAWQQSWHGTWDLVWADSPVPGSIIFVAWHSEDKHQRRYEILESHVPSLVGMMYRSNGKTAHICHRFAPHGASDLGLTNSAESLSFSPITHAFEAVTQQLTYHPQTITQKIIDDNIIEYQFTYAKNSYLIAWLDMDKNLITSVNLHTPQASFNLVARSLEPLPESYKPIFEFDNCIID